MGVDDKEDGSDDCIGHGCLRKSKSTLGHHPGVLFDEAYAALEVEWRCAAGVEPTSTVLETVALPLGDTP